MASNANELSLKAYLKARKRRDRAPYFGRTRRRCLTALAPSSTGSDSTSVGV